MFICTCLKYKYIFCAKRHCACTGKKKDDNSLVFPAITVDASPYKLPDDDINESHKIWKIKQHRHSL